MERKFLVLLRRFRLQNEHFVLYHLWLFSVVNFSVLTARRDASSRCPVVTLNFIMPPTEFSGNSLKWIVLGTNKSVCACPAHPVRAQIPAVFRRYYKTAGIASHKIHISIEVPIPYRPHLLHNNNHHHSLSSLHHANHHWEN